MAHQKMLSFILRHVLKRVRGYQAQTNVYMCILCMHTHLALYRLKLTNGSTIFGILIEDTFVAVADNQIKCISREISFVV